MPALVSQNERFNITGFASSGSGIYTNYEFRFKLVSDTNYTTFPGCNGSSSTCTTSLFNEGKYDIQVIVTDSIGNTAVSNTDLLGRNPKPTVMTVLSKNIVNKKPSNELSTLDISVDISTTDVSCAGGNNGSATANVTDGTAPYTFAWSNLETSQTINNLSAGVYAVTVTDAAATSATASATVAQSSSALSVSTTSTDVSCYGGNNGSAAANASGTPPYTFLWSDGQVSQNINNLIIGTYTVTVTDAQSCTATSSAMITQPSSSLSVTTTNTNVSCYGENNGSAMADVSGGTAPYIYVWSNGSTSQTITNLIIGTYDVTVTDNQGCTATDGSAITQPDQLIANVSPSAISIDSGQSTTLTSSVSGGTPNYNYLWSNSETIPAISVSPSATTIYNLTVSDSNLCTTTASSTVTIAINVGINTTDVSCAGGSNGSATATVTDGTAPYTFAWSNGGTSQTINNLPAGTYSVTVTDATTTTATASATITQPTSALTVNTTSTNVSCYGGNNGTAMANASGGTNYTYAWSTGATSQTINNLTMGNYNVTVTDGQSCTATAGATITQPTSAVSVNIASTNVICYGESNGSATANASGGASNYNYFWNNAQTSQTLNNLSAGTYSVTVIDTQNCTATNSKTIAQPAQLIANISPSAISIDVGQSTTLTSGVSGGTSDYSYLWSNSETIPAISVSPSATTIYNLTVSDSNSCTTTASSTVTIASSMISLSPSDLAFGNETIGVPSDIQTIEVANTGNASITISSITTSANYSQTNNCISSLAVGETCTISVTFTPTNLGLIPGTLTISSNASNNPQIANLTGTGITSNEVMAQPYTKQPAVVELKKTKILTAALMSSPGFDISQVNQNSLALGGAPVQIGPNHKARCNTVLIQNKSALLCWYVVSGSPLSQVTGCLTSIQLTGTSSSIGSFSKTAVICVK